MSAPAQGFVNLGFEGAGLLVTPTPPGQFGTQVDPNFAFNGWGITNALGPGHYPLFSLYNNLTIGSSAVVLIGPQFPNALSLTPLQGSYSVMLQGFPGTNVVGLPAIFQNGVVPADARSINFLLSQGNPRVTFAGVEIPLVPMEGGRVAGDIAAFAGQEVQMMLSPHAGAHNFVYFDDVQFSAQAVPEPSAYALSMLALVAVTLFRKRRE